MLRIIQGMYKGLTAKIQLGEITTGEIKPGGRPQTRMLNVTNTICTLCRRTRRQAHANQPRSTTWSAIFFTDDMVIFGESQEELLDVVSKYGREKRMSFNEKKNWMTEEGLKWKLGKEALEEGAEREIVIDEFEDYKYLGLIVQIKGNTFQTHLERLGKNTNQLAGRTMATAMKSASRTLIGKELWEKESLTSLLHGAEVIVYPRKEVDVLERAQNGVARRLLGASPREAVEALQGELA